MFNASIGYLDPKGAPGADLSKGELYSLMLALLQMIHQLLNGLVVPVRLLLPRGQLLLALREVDKLLQSLLVHMAVLLQLLVTLVQLLP